MPDQSLDDYANRLFPVEDDLLRRFKQEAAAEGLPEIQVPEEAARFLQAMVTLSGAANILEVGTLFGYSTIVMARALPNDGKIITLERDPKHADVAQRNFHTAGLGEKIDLRLGPALETFATLSGEKFDLVFIDADKRTYPDYLARSLQLTPPGALILADNVWRDGAVIVPEDDDIDTQGLAKFNRMIAEDARLFSTFVPTREGTDALSLSVVR